MDRRSRFLILVKLPSRHTTAMVPAVIEVYSRLDLSLPRTLTWDCGMELAAHKALTAATGIDVYFADPRSPCNAAPTSWCASTTEGNEPGDLQPGDLDAIERPAEHPASQVPRISQPGRECCVDRLNVRAVFFASDQNR